MNNIDINGIVQALFKTIKLEDNKELKAKKLADFLEWIEWLKNNSKISQSQYDLYTDEVTHALSFLRVNENRKNKAKIILPLIATISLIVVAVALAVIVSRSTEDMVADNAQQILPFRGQLLDSEGKSITEKTDVVFNLYNSVDSERSLYKGVCQGEMAINPDYNGQFTVTLGSDCGMSPLPVALFDTYEQLYLGVTIANSDEISPRFLLYTGPIKNASTLNSLQTGTKKSSIVYINDFNEIVLSDEDPVIKATSGNLVFEGASLSLKSTSDTAGNIELIPSLLGSVLITGGNVGIGTLLPSSKLEVIDTEPSASVLSIGNLSKESLEGMNVLSLGVSVDGSDRASFVRFYKNRTISEQGDFVGSIDLVDDRIVYGTSGADYAEYFDSTESIPEGSIVGLSSKGIRKADRGDVVVGVVSDSAGYVGNQSADTANKVLVGLVGQVDVLITDQGGPVRKGDSIGIAYISGLGMKTDDNIVGYSLDMAIFTASNCPPQTSPSIQCAYVKVLLK